MERVSSDLGIPFSFALGLDYPHAERAPHSQPAPPRLLSAICASPGPAPTCCHLYCVHNLSVTVSASPTSLPRDALSFLAPDGPRPAFGGLDGAGGGEIGRSAPCLALRVEIAELSSTGLFLLCRFLLSLLSQAGQAD